MLCGQLYVISCVVGLSVTCNVCRVFMALHQTLFNNCNINRQDNSTVAQYQVLPEMAQHGGGAEQHGQRVGSILEGKL